jgi:hypothetical protein
VVVRTATLSVQRSVDLQAGIVLVSVAPLVAVENGLPVPAVPYDLPVVVLVALVYTAYFPVRPVQLTAHVHVTCVAPEPIGVVWFVIRHEIAAWAGCAGPASTAASAVRASASSARCISLSFLPEAASTASPPESVPPGSARHATRSASSS